MPSFGPLDARLLIAGLAPGLQGANRTGRPFTGDWAGDLLYDTLLKLGLAKGVYEERIDDTLELVDCRIANSVRCVPPQNKPLARRDQDLPPIPEFGIGDAAERESDPGLGQDRP